MFIATYLYKNYASNFLFFFFSTFKCLKIIMTLKIDFFFSINDKQIGILSGNKDFKVINHQSKT